MTKTKDNNSDDPKMTNDEKNQTKVTKANVDSNKDDSPFVEITRQPVSGKVRFRSKGDKVKFSILLFNNTYNGITNYQVIVL